MAIILVGLTTDLLTMKMIFAVTEKGKNDMAISEQIIQVINALCEKFGIAINWTEENVIPYVEVLCRKLIIYEIATSIVWVVIMALLSVGSIVATKKFAPTFKEGLAENARNYGVGWELGTTFAIIALAVLNTSTVIVVETQIMDIIKCLTFPEMYVFEYISALVK